MNYYKTGQFAKLANVSERTIRYYDKIGLLKPSFVMENGYRQYSDLDLLKLLGEYNILFVLYKGMDLGLLEDRIIDVGTLKKKEEVEDKKPMQEMTKEISRLLHDLGMPSHIKGYQYIREGILLLYNNPDIVGGITKELYPEIASRFDTSVSRVERAIRHAIEVSWNRGNLDLMEEVFGHSVDYDKAKPTNSEFIVTVADKLKLEYGRIKA